jgi:caffeoyl-CoA O-methyltransferase
MDFLDPAIERYALAHTHTEPEILAQLNRETWLKMLQPRMLSGHMQGRLLSLFSKLIRPERILEIGTYTGYSAICMAEGLAADGILHTIDVNEELETMLRQYISKAGMTEKISLHFGSALEIIPQLDEKWDLVFIDADKENYLNYFNLVIDAIRPGGLIIADNVLWSGKVLQDAATNDEETKAIQNFNKAVSSDTRVECQLLPIRDGLMVLRKK